MLSLMRVMVAPLIQWPTNFVRFSRRSPIQKMLGVTRGLVNTVTAASVAWTQMKGASDYDASNSTANQVRSTDGAVWQKYIPSSTPEFSAKGYDVKYSIDWSSGVIPNTLTPQTKLRFTH